MRVRTPLTLFLIATLAVSTPAEAHNGLENHVHGALDAFSAGALHPLGGLDHLLAMLGVGLWSALSARRAGWALAAGPLAFSAVLLAAALAGLAGLKAPALEPLVASTVLALGLLTATRLRLPAGAGAGLCALLAVFHGLAHGAELGGAHALAALAGMVLSSLLLHATGLALGWRLRTQSTRLSGWLGGAVAAAGATLMLA